MGFRVRRTVSESPRLLRKQEHVEREEECDGERREKANVRVKRRMQKLMRLT